MAAEVISQSGLPVHLYDAMPTVGRKFLLAGKGGLNLTHSEPLEQFLDRYGEIGEYMRLELKLLLRNKICKRSLYSITGVVIMFSSIISFWFI